jgi:NAD(P)-dependent dehydrogenase (short-subunit alcohol dehydrogenase family)
VHDEGEVALVVGGSGDIGRAIAGRLGKLGYRLVITGRSEERLEAATRELRGAGQEVRAIRCDLADDSSIEALFDEIRRSFGRLDVLVNSAGMGEPRFLLKADARHLENTLRVNLVGPALAARNALLLMRKSGSGAIINIASMGGREGRRGFGAYCASKGALIALSDSLREEAARFGVRVSTICPDKVDTRMHGENAERAGMIPPSDVAEAVAFLLQLSPAAVVREVQLRNREAD